MLIQKKKKVICANEYFQYLRRNSDSIIIIKHDDLKTNWKYITTQYSSKKLGVCPCVATGETIFLHKHQSDEGIYLAFLQDWNNKVYYTTYKNNP